MAARLVAAARREVERAAQGSVLYFSRFREGRESQLTGYLPVVIYLALIVGFAVISLVTAWLLRPSRPHSSFSKEQNYECGAEPIGTAWVQFPVGFYLVALVFIVFDALAVFLFPFALVLRDLGVGALWAMGGFLGILTLGWVYAYREGILEWK
jgi:NADH-quinone oxidoreductase subunit A